MTVENWEGNKTGLWKVADVAKYLRVSNSWVYHQAESGRLPCIRLGALVRFDPTSVIDFAKRESGQGAGRGGR